MILPTHRFSSNDINDNCYKSVIVKMESNPDFLKDSFKGQQQYSVVPSFIIILYYLDKTDENKPTLFRAHE